MTSCTQGQPNLEEPGEGSRHYAEFGDTLHDKENAENQEHCLAFRDPGNDPKHPPPASIISQKQTRIIGIGSSPC